MDQKMQFFNIDGNAAAVIDQNTILHHFFTTQIQITKWNEGCRHNKEIARFVHSLESASNGVSNSNIGGYQSGQLLNDNDPPALKLLASWVKNMFVQYIRLSYDKEVGHDAVILDAWANVNRAGDINAVHCHGSSLCSAVYYAALPEVEGDFGQLMLHDPRPFHPFHESISIAPDQSLLVMFPGWLKHSVNPFRGDGERVSIAFNCEIKESTPRMMK